MGAIAAKIAGNTANSPATGSVTLGDLANLATFSTIGNQTGTSSTPTAVAMNCIPGLRSQATAAGTTTLVNTDVLEQVFTGVTTQTVVLPVVTTLKQAGWQYLIINDSSGAVTINSSGSNAVQVVAAGARCLVSNNKITADTTAAAWEVMYVPVIVAGLVATDLLRSYLATTVTYNANAVLADTALSVTVAAGGIYAIELVVQSTSAVKGLNMDFAGTATIANFIGEWQGHNAAGYVDGSSARVTAAGTDFGPAGPLDGASSLYTFTGSVEITDAGTFLLRGAQNVSDPTNTTILRGSTLVLTRMN